MRVPPSRSSLLPLLGVLAACPGPAPAPPAPGLPSPCIVAEEGPTPPDTVRIALTDPVEPGRAPIPANDGEAMVFASLYEPLVRLDCDGAPATALAIAWRSEDGGRRWTFTLRPGAAFWDGTPLDADALLAGWRTADSLTPVEGVRSDRASVTVFLTEARPLAFFGAPALRVTKRIPESAWPLGTGPWWVRDAGAADGMLVAQPVRNLVRPLALTIAPGADARDLSDAGADLLVTRDPAVRAYVETRAGWMVVPLSWDRGYALTSRAASEAASFAFPPSFLEALARDAVPGDARPLQPEAGAPGCPLAGGDGAPIPLRPRLVYRRRDPVARALAERLVARADFELAALLGEGHNRGSVTAVGLPDADFAAARGGGEDLGYVVIVDPAAPPPCSAPLVQTRAYVLVREGVGRLVRDARGARLEPGRPRQ